MTAKKTVSAFQLNEALASAVQNTIPPVQLRRLNGEQSQAILQACAECAGKITEALKDE